MVRYAPTIRKSPWPKFSLFVARCATNKPFAVSVYIAPMAMPLTRS
jgi:hypothetical protein